MAFLPVSLTLSLLSSLSVWFSQGKQASNRSIIPSHLKSPSWVFLAQSHVCTHVCGGTERTSEADTDRRREMGRGEERRGGKRGESTPLQEAYQTQTVQTATADEGQSPGRCCKLSWALHTEHSPGTLGLRPHFRGSL